MSGRGLGPPLGLALALAACGGPPAASDASLGTRRQEIRPTDGTGWNNNGYGVAAQVYDPPGNHFRVWYVTTTDSAVDPVDVDPKDGVPDFPELVGALAESTYQSTVVDRGFRPPLDDSIYHDRPDYGGDGRYDIYLRRAGAGADGYRVSEVCTDGSAGDTAGRCSGYFVMNPSFRNTTYPSERAAVEVLVSHELFHSVQDAYSSGQWRTWSEGTAVWNELQVFPHGVGTFRDYLGFLPGLFNEPERPFDKSMGSGPAGAYAYGTAAWAEFLSERFGPQTIRAIWEGCEALPTGEVPSFLDATDALLKRSFQSSLAAAFAEFTRWNLFTAGRAVSGHGYRRAAEYPEVRFEADLTAVEQTASVELNGLAARYLRFRPSLYAPTRLRIELRDPTSATPMAAAAAAYLVPAGGSIPGPTNLMGAGPLELELEPGQSLLFVLTGTLRGARSRNVELATSIIPPSHPPEMMSGGCSMLPTASRRSSVTWELLGGLLVLAAALRRRRLCASNFRA